MLSTNSPGGVAQFWDRDAPAEMAKVSMEGLQEFMVKPDNLSTGDPGPSWSVHASASTSRISLI